ncbi:beta family protein [Croceibacterium ferulae]|uniref:beta family protein n=1 Tax=Croceibacterium ferulae TaxID=1854641 RepID=UPI000EAECECF|nr:beta family protein [Croceibacterium ferulae]
MHASQAIYLPQLKWKAGERRALKSVSSARSGRVLPAFKIPPAGSFDPDQQRVLTTVEYLHSFGRQLADCWDRRLAFIDAELIDDQRHSAVVTDHPLTALIERARLAGANAAPVFGLRNSAAYYQAVQRYAERNPAAPACFRLELGEIESVSSAETLTQFASQLSLTTQSVILLLDGGPLEISDGEDFTHLLSAQVARLIAPNTWARVFWSATSFPEKPRLKAGMDGQFSRADWKLYQAILANSAEFPIVPMFSDYALEYPSAYAPFNGAPSAHLRYSCPEYYHIFKGPSVRKERGYKAIFEVAERLVASDAFSGVGFSSGDAFIHQLADGMGRTGDAAAWRWSATDHHFTLVIDQLAKAMGLEHDVARTSPAAKQLELI